MSEMISVASDFQYSINIAYDLSNDDKLKNFIPTKSSLDLLKDILLSTNEKSNERSRILIGAYGKGKSHIILTILSLLMKKDRNVFKRLNPLIKKNKELKELIDDFYATQKPILPVIITGSNTSLTQAFLIALQRTLKENDLLDIMPDTNYLAAIKVIERWEKDYPKTFEKFEHAIQMPSKEFKNQLEDYNIDVYHQFEKVYKHITSGTTFNPFLGFDVVELYEGVAKELSKKGYSGLYVVYDEFSKYLEANITQASVSDTKTLQDFAEKCNRSGKIQMHLMLISHKEISNYIDKLPKSKVDGWRGVSERFKHVHLNNNFTQTYEIIASVIEKEKKLYNKFLKDNLSSFEALFVNYKEHPIFSEMTSKEIKNTIISTYPLHPVSTFILPRLSERVAQNERTLFTFLSSDGENTLKSFLNLYNDNDFKVVTPDMIYDYFEPLFKKETTENNLQKTYLLTSLVLDKLENGSLECKIIKTLSLIYILEQYEKLKPTEHEIQTIFAVDYNRQEVATALKNLIDKEFIIYLKQSNHFLQIKQSSGININERISDVIEKQRKNINVKSVLNHTNIEKYLYPARYNDEREMTRYFAFEFITEDEIREDVNWNVKSENIEADGVIYAVIPNGFESISNLKNKVLKSSKNYEKFVFIVPNTYVNIDETIRKYRAVETLIASSTNEKVLQNEYEVIFDDLAEVINTYINGYTHPETFQSTYIFNGNSMTVTRKAELSSLVSDICDKQYNLTPIIINESINKNHLTSTASKSRDKVIAALLRNELSNDLGLIGHGQDVTIMRTVLKRTGVLINDNESSAHLNLDNDNKSNISTVFNIITDFIDSVKENGKLSFGCLYKMLISSQYHVGMRKGLIPIYIACVFHEFKSKLVIINDKGECPINVDTLLQINSQPENFYLKYLNWDQAKENYIQGLENIFAEYIKESEKNLNSYNYVITAMHRWLLSLPKYSKESKRLPNGEKICKENLSFIKLLKQNTGIQQLLFESIPKIYNKDEFNADLVNGIEKTKNFYDHSLENLELYLIHITKGLFNESTENIKTQMSLTSVIRDWCDNLDPSTFNQLFGDGTEKCLELFKTITNDEVTFVKQLAKISTGLRIEDWNDKTIKLFISNVKKYKNTAEEFHNELKQDTINTDVVKATKDYALSYVDENGNTVVKQFDHVEESGRGRLLKNMLNSQLSAMGQSVSEQEKRQILMEILKGLC